jgi:hypothetical protein
MFSPRIQCVCLTFTSQARIITSRPFVPSQERDWSSVFIPAIHISEDQRSTSPIASSVTSSLVRVLRMFWQSRDEQREALLDVGSFETPQVKTDSEETN